MFSLRFCHSSKTETKYICVISQEPTYNRPDCTVFLPEETPYWKSGHSLSACLLCHNNSEVNANCHSELQTTPLSSNTQSGVTQQKKSSANFSIKGNSKEELLKFRTKSPGDNLCQRSPQQRLLQSC